MIELGIDMFGDLRIDPATGQAAPAARRMQELLTEVKLMDEVGLDFFAIGEHHRDDFAVTSPEVVLAAAAAVTKNIKLGSAVSVISSADPVKLFQDFATVDLISDGRAEIMAGRGSFIESFPVFGFDLADYADLFEEKLGLLLQLNQSANQEANQQSNQPACITWSGKFRPPLTDQPIFPRPKNGRLPIWIAVGGTPASIIRAARLGLPVMFAIIGGALENFKPLFDLYRQTWQDSGHAMGDLQVGVHLHAFFGEPGDATADAYYPVYAARMTRIGAERGWPAYRRAQYDAGRSMRGHLVIGDADYAVEKILHCIDTFGLTRFSAHMDTGAPSHADLMKSIELYGTRIAPSIKAALKNRREPRETP